MKSHHIDKIIALFVTYYPDRGFLERFRAAQCQLNKFVIVDNNSKEVTTVNLLTSLENQGCHIIRNTINLGVAAALNQGIDWAAKNGYRWVLTLDQDTLVYPGLIDFYSSAIDNDIPFQNLGVINTAYRDVNTNKPGVNPGIKKGWTEVAALITSGSFFSIETFLKVGPFREDFFLDWADHDFCLRARAKGLKNYIYHSPYMDHTLGNKTEHKIMFTNITILTNNHSAFRCYLISRNLCILLKNYLLREPVWAAYLTFYLISKFCLVLLFEKNKTSKLKNLFKGLHHGIFNIPSKSMIQEYQNN